MDLLIQSLTILRQHEAELRARGVVYAAIFGSVARGEARPDSDVDVLIDLDPAVRLNLFAYAGIAADLQEWIGHPVDLARRARLRPHVRPSVEASAVRAF